MTIGELAPQLAGLRWPPMPVQGPVWASERASTAPADDGLYWLYAELPPIAQRKVRAWIAEECPSDREPSSPAVASFIAAAYTATPAQRRRFLAMAEISAAADKIPA